MEVWVLVLYLGALGKVEPPGHFDTKTDCIEVGKSILRDYDKHHPHSAGFFWCVPGQHT